MNSPLHELLTKAERGSPMTSEYLSHFGVSAQSAATYVKHGWLKRLQRGVFAFPADELTVLGVVKYFEEQYSDIHVASKTALAWNGIIHNIDFSDSVILFGESRFSIPSWASSLPIRYVRTTLFSKEALSYSFNTVNQIQTAIPERAILEMLYEVGNGINIEEGRHIFEDFLYPRKKILGKLLANCTSLKVTRLFAMWAKETKLLNVESFYNEYHIQRGSSSFWSVKVANGSLSLHP